MCVKHGQKKKSNGSFKMRHFFFTNKISDKKVDRESGFYILHIMRSAHCIRLLYVCESVESPFSLLVPFLAHKHPVNLVFHV